MSQSANSSAKKSKTKTDKDQRYDNMLKSIDLKLDKADEKQQQKDAIINNHDDDNDLSSFGKNDGGAGLSILDLVSNLQKNDKTSGQTAKLRSDVSELIQKKAFKEAPSVRMQEEMDRKANYDIVKNDVKKWQGVIKKNREAQHVDFTKKPDQKFRINSTQLNTQSKSELENKVEAKLKELNLFKEEDILNEEKEMLKKLNPDEAKRRETDLAKHRNLMFYQELKNKRVSKIKSKLYHRIKNKKEKRLHDKMMENMEESDPAAQLREIEDLEKKRAQERISLRHKNKSKYVSNMMRYGNIKDTKQSVSDLSQLRKAIMKKIDPDQKDRLYGQLAEEGEDLYEDLDDQQFKEKMMSELEDYLKRGGEEEDDEESSKKKKKATGFMKRMLDQQDEKSRQEAEELLAKFKNSYNLDDFQLSEEDQAKDEDEMEEEKPEGEEKNKNKRSKEPLEQGMAGRKKFHKEQEGNAAQNKNTTGAIEIEDYKKNVNNKSTKNILNSYLDNQDEQPGMQVETPLATSAKKKGKASGDKSTGHLDRLEPKDILFSGDNEGKKESQKKEKESETKKKNKNEDKDDLVAGLNFDTLKQKYNKSNNTQFLGEEIEKFNEENKQDIYHELSNFQVVGSNIYNEDFDEEKGKLYEGELPEEKKQLKGWGSWAGIGIKEKKVNPDLELKRKIQKIEELKRQRKDGKLDNVILHEERNKLVKKYLVRDLPHPYKSADQFDYVQGVPLGPEWNSLRNHQKLVKPKVITKAGEIIAPIQAPKNRKNKNA